MTTHYKPRHISDLVSENVRALMARTKTKQQSLADALGMTQGAVSKKMNGDRPFTLDELELVASHFGVPITVLFEESNVLPFPRGLADDAASRRATLDESARSSTDRASDYGSLVRFPQRRPVLTLVRGRAS